MHSHWSSGENSSFKCYIKGSAEPSHAVSKPWCKWAEKIAPPIIVQSSERFCGTNTFVIVFVPANRQPFNADFGIYASANPFCRHDRRHLSYAFLFLRGKHCMKCVISSERNRYWHVNTFPLRCWNVGMRIFLLTTNETRQVSEKDVAEFAMDILCNLHRDSYLRWSGTQPSACLSLRTENCQWIFTDARKIWRKFR